VETLGSPRPHGGKLLTVRSLAPTSEHAKDILSAPRITIDEETERTVSNLATGVLSPLDGFMSSADYHSVLSSMRLKNDTPWTIPILLHVPEGQEFRGSDEIALVNGAGEPVAKLEFQESFLISKKEHAKSVYGTDDLAHPGVAKLFGSSPRVVAGRLKEVVLSPNNPFEKFVLTPKETRVLFKEKGWNDIIAFQTRNAPHIGHEYVQKTALAFVDGIFINPVIGKKKPGDFTDEVILQSYQALVEHYYPKSSVVLSILMYEMHYAGPKEAIMHAIMRKNFGCTHIAIGRDHAGVGNYYSPYAAHEIFKEFPDLGIEPVFFREFFYCTKCAGIANEKICPHPESDRLTFSGTKLRKMFQSGERPPKEFMRPEVSDVILNSKEPFVS
jgi:sulfate adenylyltransferase